MGNFFVILKALFKNKFRLDASKSKVGTVAIAVSFIALYAVIMYLLMSAIFLMREIIFAVAPLLYFSTLIVAAFIVMIFGIIYLVSTLYLSKDTDFYSILPVKATTVFAAKLAFVYILEMAITVAIILPVLIELGILAKLWAWYYVITLASIVIVPALPLVVAAIFAIPTMYFASKIKNRGIVAIVFFVVLYTGLLSFTTFFSHAAGEGDLPFEEIIKSVEIVLNIFYPYKALTMAACYGSLFGLDAATTAIVGFLIYVGISLVLLAILLCAAKFMYAQSVKANNQTNNDKAKRGIFKQTNSIKALIKREYMSSLRTTQITFQCYVCYILPIIITVICSISFSNLLKSLESISEISPEIGDELHMPFFSLMMFSTLAAVAASIGNAAASTFSREGEAMASLKVLPIDIKTIFKAKVITWLVPAIISSVISVFIINCVFFNPADAVLSFFSLVPLVVAQVIFGAVWDLAAPKLKWTDPMQAVKHNGHIAIVQILSAFAGLVPLFLLTVLGNFLSFETCYLIFWLIIYFELAVFIVLDIVFYTKIEKFYAKIEL